MASLPKLYRISHPHCPWQVRFTDPLRGRVRRYFADRQQAEAYHRQLLAQAKVAGTSGLVLDVEMRADYYAAVNALDGVPLRDAVAFWLKHHPPGLANVPLIEALDQFLADKARNGRAIRTLTTLRSRLEAFLDASQAGPLPASRANP